MTLLSALRFLWGLSIPTARVKNEATVLAESLNCRVSNRRSDIFVCGRLAAFFVASC